MGRPGVLWLMTTCTVGMSKPLEHRETTEVEKHPVNIYRNTSFSCLESKVKAFGNTDCSFLLPGSKICSDKNLKDAGLELC